MAGVDGRAAPGCFLGRCLWRRGAQRSRNRFQYAGARRGQLLRRPLCQPAPQRLLREPDRHRRRPDYGSTRFIANNLAAGGIEAATASYDGSFISRNSRSARRIASVASPSSRACATHSCRSMAARKRALPLPLRSRTAAYRCGSALRRWRFPCRTRPRRSNRVGVEAWTSNGDDVWAIVLGQTVGFAPGGNNQVTGFFGADRDDQHQRLHAGLPRRRDSCRRRRLGSLRRPRRPEDQLLARIRRICWSDPVVLSMTAAHIAAHALLQRQSARNATLLLRTGSAKGLEPSCPLLEEFWLQVRGEGPQQPQMAFYG